MAIDDRKVEHIFEQFQRAIKASQDLDLGHKQALVERFRVDLMVRDSSPPRKALYRAIIDMQEHAIEAEVERLDAAKPKASKALVNYMKRLLDGLD